MHESSCSVYVKDNGMELENADDIFDFAIAREKEAVLFYQNLQEMVRFTDKKELLRKFESMERGHIVVIEQIRRENPDVIDVPQVQNLHISDYIVAGALSEEMSYQDIIILAMKKEEAAFRLYTDLAAKGMNATVRKLFDKLASEEAKHKLSFERMYDDEILRQY